MRIRRCAGEAFPCRSTVAFLPPVESRVFVFVFGPRKRSSRSRYPPSPTRNRAATKKGKTAATAAVGPVSSRRRRTEAVVVVPQTRNSPPAIGRTARTTRTRCTPPSTRTPKTTAAVCRRAVDCLFQRRQPFVVTEPNRTRTIALGGTACTRLPRMPVTGSGMDCPPA